MIGSLIDRETVMYSLREGKNLRCGLTDVSRSPSDVNPRSPIKTLVGREDDREPD